MSRFLGCRSIFASAGIGIGIYHASKNIVSAKEETSPTKVYGFIGIPDTHSLETYLKWKNIPFERVEVDPLKIESIFAETDCDARTPFDIPVLEEDGVYISGSSLAISILESQENFARNNEFFSLEELKKRFPKVKVAWQTMESALNKFLFTQEKVMNRCWTLHPVQDKLDVDMDKQTLRFHKITKRANKARTLADEELKPLLLHTMHLDYSQSFRNTSKFYENVDVPLYSKHLTLASYAHARKSNYKDYLSGRRKVIESGEKGADHGTLMGFESEGIWNEIASKIADLAKIKSRNAFFGGETPNFADVEIFGLLNFLDTYEPQMFERRSEHWLLIEWYRDMKSIVYGDSEN